MIFGGTKVCAQVVDQEIDWRENTQAINHTGVFISPPIGGRSDLMGNGALLLSKKDSSKSFWQTDQFSSIGTWTSKWIAGEKEWIKLNWFAYGQRQSMQSGWEKFSGNPLINVAGSVFNTEQTLALPVDYGDTPADQSIVKGVGAYKGRWLLLFNIGGWAVKGWGMAVADDLAPLLSGKNPFKLADPYPLTKATGGYHAPNDWIYAGGTWYAPDECRNHVSNMWTSTDLSLWTLQGPIRGINGHDPGMVWDGDSFYLFNEANDQITLVYSDDPLGEWKTWPENEGPVLDLGDHTGDADVSFFNNRWHMFMDDGIHRQYKISYAWTTPDRFPLGWTIVPEIFGPKKPDQGQQWDDANVQGNDFGTGDADVVLDGTTLYMTYETPVGIAYKHLEVNDDTDLKVEAIIAYEDEGTVVQSNAIEVEIGESRVPFSKFGLSSNLEKFKVILKLSTNSPYKSPLIDYIEIH